MNRFRKSALLSFFSLATGVIAQAEFLCRSEVHYSWQPIKTGQVSVKKDATDGAKEEGSSTQKVFWGSFEMKGATQEEIKPKLQLMTGKEGVFALSACRDVHENQTKCLSIKYSQNVATLGVMSFSQRKEFEKKMVEDCELSAGRCLASQASEPECAEIKAAEEAKVEGKGKDAKKK